MSKKRRTSKPEKRMSVGIPLPCGEYMIFNNLTEEDAKAIIEAGKDYYRKQYGVPESAFSLRGNHAIDIAHHSRNTGTDR